jgi:hypothetical protein
MRFSCTDSGLQQLPGTNATTDGSRGKIRGHPCRVGSVFPEDFLLPKITVGFGPGPVWAFRPWLVPDWRAPEVFLHFALPLEAVGSVSVWPQGSWGEFSPSSALQGKSSRVHSPHRVTVSRRNRQLTTYKGG